MINLRKLFGSVFVSIFVFSIFLSPAFADDTSYSPDNANKVDPLQSQKQMQGNISVGKFTGAGIYNYPVSLPPGRNGMTPSVSITYNSQDESLENIVGYHWSLPEYSIKRLNKTGVEKLYQENNFVATTPLESGELVSINLIDDNHGQYGQKFETTFSKYEFKSDNSWVVTDKTGNRYIFGASEDTRQSDPEDLSHTYQWMLKEIRDTNDNFIRYSYYKIENKLYPKEILYTGHDQSDGIFRVKFLPFGDDVPGSKRDDSHYGYNAGFRIDDNYLITGIEVYADGNLRRKYDIDYLTVEPLIRQTIGSITETGYSLNGNPTTLPPTTFEYSPSEVDWEETETEYQLPNDMYFEICGYTGDCQLAPTIYWDMTGDGLVDFEYIGGYSQNAYKRTRLVNDGKDGWIDANAEIVPSSPVYFRPIPNTTTKLTDFNGDILSDLIQSYIYTSENKLLSRIDLGKGGVYVDTIEVAFGSGEVSKPDNGASLADLNGDGLPDIIRSRHAVYGPNGGHEYLKETCLNNEGQSCELTNLWEAPIVFVEDTVFGQNSRQAFMQDCNYDGLADIGGYINDGKGGWKANEPGICHSSGIDSLTHRSFDANGDGMIDRIEAYDVITSWGQVRTNVLKLNTGTGYEEYNNVFPIILGTQPNDGGDAGVRIMDINGDKLPDVIQSHKSVQQQGYNMITTITQKVFINRGTRPYFLKTVHTSGGSEIDLEYKTSAQYIKQDGSMANPNLPIIVDTVSKITTNDGMGNQSEINYFYEDGHYYYDNPQDRNFAGFRVITETDGLGNKTKSYFHQSENSTEDSANGEFEDHISKKGRPYRTEVYDNQNNIIQISINKWDKNEPSSGRYFSYLKQSISRSLTGTEKATAKSIEYDGYGNVIQSIDYGEVQFTSNNGSFTDIGNDLVKSTQTYIQNTSKYILALPVESKAFDQIGSLISHQRMYYDNLSLTEVSVGNLTTQEIWLDTGNSFLTSEIEYNEFGMPTKQTNARGYSTTTIYDGNNLFPLSVTNAKGHTSQMVFDLGTRQVIWSANPNNVVTENIYDGLGRAIKVKKTDPSGTDMTTVQTVSYNDSSMPRSTFTRIFNDDGIEIDSYQYFDGLGRTIESKQEAPNGKWITSGVIYDERGNVRKNLQSYFSSSNNFETVNGNKIGNTFIYDALNRVTSTTNPLGIISNTYNGWETTVTDTNNNPKTYAYDARGNLIRVDENNNGEVHKTNYKYDASGRLIRVEDSKLNTREFSYDSLGRRISQTKLNSSSAWQYVYDVNGNLIQRIDPKGQIINFTYDELDRQLTEDYTGESGIESSYTYDQGPNSIGLLSRINGDSYQHNFIYDLWGRTVAGSKTIDSRTFTLSYTYDQMGGVKEMTYPDSSVVSYSYNNAHLLESVSSDSKTYVSNFEYSPLGQITQMELGNGVVTTNTYDENQMYRLTDKTSLLLGSVKLQKYGYSYDSMGNLLNLTDQNNGLTAKTVNYEYDDLYRLTEARYEQTANYENLIQNYQYDSIGNMMYKSDIGLYQYNSENPHAVVTAGDQTFTYDENGNMTVRNDQSMTYDYRNRMILNTDKASFRYGEGYDRISKTNLQTNVTKYYPSKYFEATDAKETKYIYAGKLRIAKVEKVIEEEIEPPVEPPVIPPVIPPVEPPIVPPTPVPPTGGGGGGTSGGGGSTTPYPTYTVTTNSGSYEKRSGSYRTQEHMEQMWQIQNENPLPLDEVELIRTRDDSGSEIPKDFWPEAESEAEFTNLQIEYSRNYARISWDKMTSDVAKFKIYRSKEPHPQNLSKHASVLIQEMNAGGISNRFSDIDISQHEKFTYRVVALNSDDQILTASMQLHAKQIFIPENNETTVDFSRLFNEEFDNVRIAKNENLSFASNGISQEIGISSTRNFSGKIEIDARFLDCHEKNDGSLVCSKIGSDTFDVYLIKAGEESKIISFFKQIFSYLIPTAYADDDSDIETFYLLTDHLGSTDVVLDEDGNVVERADYKPFGADRLRITEADAPETDYGFTGKELDGETGLMYYGARYYDSEIGRFVSVDPLVLDEAVKTEKNLLVVLQNPQGLNGYTYVLNNPVLFVDPTGEESTPAQKLGISILKYLASKNEEFKNAVKSLTTVAVTRDVNEGTTIRGETYYKDNLSVKVGSLELNNVEVQSTVDYPNTPESWTLPSGSSYDATIGASGATKEYINDTLQIDGAYFLHEAYPKPGGKPYSQGCTVTKTDNDNREIMNILREDLGFENGETVQYSFEAAPQPEENENED